MSLLQFLIPLSLHYFLLSQTPSQKLGKAWYIMITLYSLTRMINIRSPLDLYGCIVWPILRPSLEYSHYQYQEFVDMFILSCKEFMGRFKSKKSKAEHDNAINEEMQKQNHKSSCFFHDSLHSLVLGTSINSTMLLKQLWYTNRMTNKKMRIGILIASKTIPMVYRVTI